MKTVANFILWGSKITTDGDCSHGIKRHLLLGRKAMTNLLVGWRSVAKSCLTLQSHAPQHSRLSLSPKVCCGR